MCQRLYVAADLPLRPLWRSRAEPDLEVVAVAGRRPPVARHLPGSATHLYLAGAHEPCGCGFPELASGPHAAAHPIAADDQRSLQELIGYLQAGAGPRPAIHLYFCWQGDEEKPPQHRRGIARSELARPGFRFRRGELLTLFEGGDQPAVSRDGRLIGSR